MAWRKRLCKIFMYLLLFSVSFVTLYWVGGGKSLSATMAFRRHEMQNMIGPAQIMDTVEFPLGIYNHIMIGKSDHGYTFLQWNDHNGWDQGIMTYAPKNSEVTLYCTEQLYSSSDYCMDVLPIFAFTDYPSAVRATLTITVQLAGESSVFLYPLEATITEEGYFLFRLEKSQRAMDIFLIQEALGQLIGYRIDGNITMDIALFDRNGELLTTYQHSYDAST